MSNTRLNGANIRHLKDDADVLPMADNILECFTKTQLREVLDRALHLYVHFDDVANGVKVLKLNAKDGYNTYWNVVGLCANLSFGDTLNYDRYGYKLCELTSENWKYLKGSFMFPIGSDIDVVENNYKGQQGEMRKKLLEYYIDVLTYILTR